jgi:50S ribosomal protein L16 3-hydroxylase
MCSPIPFVIHKKSRIAMPTQSLKNFDQETFLREYWQKKPLLIKGGLAGWQNPISADELAGLALEDHVESRLIHSRPIANSITESQWILEQGPFSEQRLSSLDDKNWTLLVQAVDHYAPEVAQLLSYFGFIPSWQIDDVMVSYATKGGGVGPHFDRYDVFLVQGQGQREWQIGQNCHQDTPLQEGQPLSLLTEFNSTETYQLSPGDILYVPPYAAHWGTALDNDCMTYSVGFRSPSKAEMLDDYAGYMQQHCSEDERFRDADITTSGAGAIDAKTIDNLAAMLVEQLSDKEQLRRWFGRWASQSKYAETISDEAFNINDDEEDLVIDEVDFSDSAVSIHRDTASRFYYIETGAGDAGSLQFFVNGREVALVEPSQAIQASIKVICNELVFSVEALKAWLDDEVTRKVLAGMFENGELYAEDESALE